MFRNNIDQCLEACQKELISSNNAKIKKLLKKIKEEVKEEVLHDILETVASEAVTMIIVSNASDKECQELVSEMLQEVINMIPLQKKSYTIHVALKGLEEDCYRTLRVPVLTNLADLGYFILAAFNSDFSHLFQFNIKNTSYKCEIERYSDDPFTLEGQEYALDWALASFEFKKNNKFSLCYDYGDNFIFNIQILSVNQEDVLLSMEDIEIIDGAGYGIFEDAHYEMDLFYSDREGFNTLIKENGIDADYYPIEETFEIEECNASLLETFIEIKEAYEVIPEEFSF